MAKRIYREKTETPEHFSYDTQLPVHLPVANYYRQSTMEQVGNQSTAIQTVDMVAYLKRLGWPEEKIIRIDMDAGVSGTKKIDERPGMSELFRLITRGEVGAVSSSDEDRLFRDVSQIQTNIFLEACKQNRVLVITPTMIYNFAHEHMGVIHARQFRWKSEVAAEYISSYIRGKLYHARLRLMQQGRWTGAPITPGFMIDDRKTLPGGSPNENWRKFAIFEPYAEVVREYFRIFLDCNGQLRTAARQIREQGPYFPDPAECTPPEGFRIAYRIHTHQGKRCIGKTGLHYMLTNAMYLGHWVVDNRVLIQDNHPAIIDPEIFARVYNYLSEVSLKGTLNPDYRPSIVHARPTLEAERDVDRPLLLGLMVAEDTDGSWKPLGSMWDSLLGYYNYIHYSKVKDVALWRKRAAYVDDAVTALMLERLSTTFDFEDWKAELAYYSEDVRRERQGMESQVEQLQKVMDNLLVSLATLRHPQMIAAVEKQYTEAQQEHDRLRSELAASQDEERRMQYIEKIRDSCEQVVEKWPHMNGEERRQVVQMFTSKIKASIVDRSALHLHIYWLDGSEDKITLVKQTGNGAYWTTEEIDQLIDLMHSASGQIEVMQAFPDRTWQAIRHQYKHSSEKRGVYRFISLPKPLPIPLHMSYNHYREQKKQKCESTDSSEESSVASRHRTQFSFCWSKQRDEQSAQQGWCWLRWACYGVPPPKSGDTQALRRAGLGRLSRSARWRLSPLRLQWLNQAPKAVSAAASS